MKKKAPTWFSILLTISTLRTVTLQKQLGISQQTTLRTGLATSEALYVHSNIGSLSKVNPFYRWPKRSGRMQRWRNSKRGYGSQKVIEGEAGKEINAGGA